MTLLSQDPYLTLFIMIYLIAHTPAIIMLIIAAAMRKKNPGASRTLLIIGVAYFIIGLGICGGFIG